MANIVREKPNHLPMINGVKFEQISPGVSVSADVPDDIAAVFLDCEGYRLADEDDAVPEHLIATKKTEAPAKETKAQQKAREKAEAEKAEQEKADKEAAEAASAEEAARLAAEEESKKSEGTGEPDEPNGNTEGEVF